MNALKFTSNIFKETNRYSDKLQLPDYPYTPDGAFDRESALHTVLYEEYGFVNAEGVSVTADVKAVDEKLVAGKCRVTTVEFTFEKVGDKASFPVYLSQPYKYPNAPLILLINFQPYTKDIHSKYYPIEELMDRGVAVAHVNYKEITSDDDDFSNGIARLLTDRTDPHAAGKIAIWSHALSEIATYMLQNGHATTDTLYVAGHSRLGKTALLTAARDTRFAGACVNNSGSCGAAIAREKGGERVEKICRTFPFWFCTHFHSYANRENELPFDQHYLGALVAPRKLCINTAEEDTWADTDAQYLMAEAADVIYRKMGVDGLDMANGMLKQGERTLTGNIAFLKRAGTHYFSREDWNFFIDFITK